MSIWADLPRRLTTISIAVPIILSVLTHPTSAFYFIQASHLLCAIEWIRLIPNKDDENTINDDDKHKESSPSKDSSGKSTKSGNMFAILCQHFHMILFILASIYIGTPNSTTKKLFDTNNDVQSLSHPPLTLLLPFLYIYFTICLPRHTSTHFINGFLFLSLGYFHLHLIYQYSIAHAIQFLFVVWNSDTGALIFGRTWKGDPIGKRLNSVLGRMGLGYNWLDSLQQISAKKSVTGMGKSIHGLSG